jgi:hypothetical protein
MAAPMHVRIPQGLRRFEIRTQALFEVIQQPSPSDPGSVVAAVSGIDCQSIARGWVVFNSNSNQMSGGKSILDEMTGHAAPAKPRQEEVQAPAEIDEAP